MSETLNGTLNGKRKKKLSFMLTCTNCDAGPDFANAREASRAGWVDVHRDDGPSWNDLGKCPDCQLEEAEHDAVSLVHSVYGAIDPDEKRCHELYPKIYEESRDPKYVLNWAREVGQRLKAARENVDRQKKSAAKAHE